MSYGGFIKDIASLELLRSYWDRVLGDTTRPGVLAPAMEPKDPTGEAVEPKDPTGEAVEQDS